MTENPTPAPQPDNSGSNNQPPASGGTSNGNTLPAVAHLTVFTGFLLPLIFWLVGKDQSEFADREGKNALNFGILVTIGYIISAVIGVIPIIGLLGTLVWLAVLIASLVFGIKAFQAVNKGESFTYPFTIQLVK